MKILLLGEYSNVHHTLALGLRALGHDVTVASDGDGWKNYPRDIDLKRKSLGFCGSINYLFRVFKAFSKFRGYDVVQIINPVFLSFKAERMYPFYRYLRKHNRHIVMGAFGMDYFYIKGCLDFRTFKYSDFNIGSVERISKDNTQFKRDWLYGAKGDLNRTIANDCDAIVAGLYEYYTCYVNNFMDTSKIHYIPFPIVLPQQEKRKKFTHTPIKMFIGIQESRHSYKGTDILLKAAKRLTIDYPSLFSLTQAVNVPFNQYIQMMNNSDLILDQLYSYTPAMNALEAMSRGLIVVGGGEPENYHILSEDSLRPIINVQPSEHSVYNSLLKLAQMQPDRIAQLQSDSVNYIRKHHEYINVAKQYSELYGSL